MNCPKCGYLLFGLAECRCPECGSAFQSTDFAFPPQSVHFLCPHCQKPYFGTDVHGLPNPRSFNCVRCHNTLRAAQMPVRPIREGVMGEPLRFGIPWEHLGPRRIVPAFVQTVTQAALWPGNFFRMAYAADRGAALLFAAIMAGLTLLLAAICLLALRSVYPPALSGLPPRYFAFTSLAGAILVGSGIWAAWCWLYAQAIGIILTLLSVREYEMESVVAATAYASAVLPALAMPLVGLPWYLILIAAGLREMTPAGPAAAWTAAVLPILILMNAAILTAIL